VRPGRGADPLPFSSAEVLEDCNGVSLPLAFTTTTTTTTTNNNNNNNFIKLMFINGLSQKADGQSQTQLNVQTQKGQNKDNSKIIN
jgi:hypothetical protein